MERKDLLEKGYNEEQVTEILNLLHSEKANSTKLQKDLDKANSTIADLSKVKEDFSKLQKTQLSEQEQLEAMKKEIAEQLKQSKLIRSKAEAKTVFAEIGGVEDDILDSIVTEDFDKTKSNAQALVNLIKARDEETIKKTKEGLLNANVLPNTKPNTNTEGGSNVDNTMTKEQFNKLSRAEKSKIYLENKELWTKMTQQ